MKPELSKSREEIDRLDAELIRLLARRMEAVGAIASWKRDHPEAPLMDPSREREVAEGWNAAARRHGLPTHFVSRVLREVMEWSRRDQERILNRSQEAEPRPLPRVAFQGTPGSYSDLAIRKLFVARRQGEVERQGYRTFGEALDALEAGTVTHALLPVENTVAGSINEVYRLLAEREPVVVDEEFWEVEHVLAGLPGARVDTLRVIRSQAVALQQCRRFLNGLGECVAESTYDTAAAAHSVRQDGEPSVGAICSEEAAREQGLEVLARNVSDARRNLTRFLLVAAEPEERDQRVPAKTSLILTLNHRRGALAACLDAFARRNLNLFKIESRPQLHDPWEYLFYVDVEGDHSRGLLAEALEDIRRLTNRLKILGSYPQRFQASPVVRVEVSGEDAASSRSEGQPRETGAEAHPRPGGPVRLAGRNGRNEHTTVRVGDVSIGDEGFAFIAGPCAVESRTQVMQAAAMAREAGAVMLRGGAFKPRSSPYSFQGLGFEGLKLLAEAGRTHGLPIVTEVLRAEDVERVAETADMLQVGARNMQNFALLSTLARCPRPVLLKRGMSATIEELLLASEYIMAGGNHQVVLCERGIRTFETATRSTLDVSAVPVLKERTHLPVIVDPSHAAGRRDLVIPLALAAVAAGADGLIVEIHPDPESALCDKDQALGPGDLEELVRRLRPLLAART